MRFQRTLAIAGLALAVLLPGGVRAQEKPSIDPTPYLGKDWYGVYIHGDKVGCAEVTRTREKSGDTPTVVIEMRVTIKMLIMEEKVEMRMEQRWVYAASGLQELLEARSLESTGDETLERTGTRGKDGFVIRTLQGKEETERETVMLPRETLSDAFCMESLAVEGAKPGTKRKATGFDLDDGTETEDEYEVIGFDEGFTGGIKARIVVVRHTDSKTGERFTARLGGQGKLLEGEFGGSMQIRLEPEDLAKDIRYSADLFAKGLLRTSSKLGPPEKVRALALRIRGVDAALDLPSDGRQTVTKEKDGAVLLNLKTEVARETLPVATDSDSKDALKSTSYYPCTNPEIQALARKAVGDAPTPEEKVRRLVAFVSDYVADEDCNTSVSAHDVLRNRKGDCTEHAMLFIALCRSLGVPAREISGLMYGGDEFGAFGGHAWAEVALDGRWVSADPTWGEFPVDATHIKYDEGEKAENGLRMLSGKVKIEVVSVETVK